MCSKKLAEKHQGWGAYQAKELVDIKDHLDQQDWDLIDNAPFLLFYAERYLGLRRPATYGSYGSATNHGDGTEELNEVPF